jgi:hypothetical protein
MAEQERKLVELKQLITKMNSHISELNNTRELMEKNLTA